MDSFGDPAEGYNCRVKGRGLTMCLFCGDDETKLVFGDPYVVRGIAYVCATDKYRNMMKFCLMCLRCIGRIQQIVEFATIKEKENNGSSGCNFCYRDLSDEIIRSEWNGEICEAVNSTRWVNDFTRDYEFKCCYACYGNLKMFEIMTTQLDVAHTEFTKAINGNWTIQLMRLEDMTEEDIKIKKETCELAEISASYCTVVFFEEPAVTIPTNELETHAHANHSEEIATGDDSSQPSHDVNSNVISIAQRAKMRRNSLIVKKFKGTPSTAPDVSNPKTVMTTTPNQEAIAVEESSKPTKMFHVSECKSFPTCSVFLQRLEIGTDHEYHKKGALAEKLPANKIKINSSPPTDRSTATIVTRRSKSFSTPPKPIFEAPVTRSNKSIRPRKSYGTEKNSSGASKESKERKRHHEKSSSSVSSKKRKEMAVNIQVAPAAAEPLMPKEEEYYLPLQISDDEMMSGLEIFEDYVEYSIPEPVTHQVTTEIEFINQQKVVKFFNDADPRYQEIIVDESTQDSLETRSADEANDIKAALEQLVPTQSMRMLYAEPIMSVDELMHEDALVTAS